VEVNGTDNSGDLKWAFMEDIYSNWMSEEAQNPRVKNTTCIVAAQEDEMVPSTRFSNTSRTT